MYYEYIWKYEFIGTELMATGLIRNFNIESVYSNIFSFFSLSWIWNGNYKLYLVNIAMQKVNTLTN